MTRIHLNKWLLMAAGLTLGLSACNAVPPTMVVMQITNTPDPRVINITITNTPQTAATVASPQQAASPTTVNVAQAVTAVTPSVAATSGALPTAIATTIPATVVPTTAVPAISPTFGATATPNAFPTETRQQIYIAQEDFEHGYMFWVQATQDIWVLLPPKDASTAGEWRVFKDTFKDGEPEVDPTLVPPSASLYQPRRGFGKLWRANPDIRAALGWGKTPEFGINTSYVYQPGGYLDANNKWIAGPGTHFLTTLSRETFEFHEPQPGQAFGTWRKVG